jgi:SPP1 gp7 family putative phage head morphogenesis protein
MAEWSDMQYEVSYNPLIKVDAKRPITDEIASFPTDLYMFQGWLPVVENPDEVLNLEGGGDIALYDQIGRDPRVASSLRTRAKAVVGREWKIIPYSQETIDIKVAEYVEKVFLDFPYDRCRRSVLRGGILKGFSVAETMWDYSEGDTFIKDMRYRHQRRFKFGPDGSLRLLTLGNPWPGVNVTLDETTGLLLKKFQVVTFGDEVISPYGVGLGKELYWPWWFKKNVIKAWLILSNKTAEPTAAGEYPAGTPKEKQMELLAAAGAVHSNNAIVFPQGMNLRFIEAQRSGSITCHQDLSTFMNDEMTICILGQLATTGQQPGKMGNNKEQETVYSDYIKDDADSLCEAQNDRQNGVIPWLVDYQFPGLGRYPKIWIKTEDEEDGRTLAERDKALAEAMDKGGKYRLGKNYWMRNHSIKDDEIEEKEQPKEPVAEPKKEIPAKRDTTVSLSEPADGGDALPDNADALAVRLMEEARAPFEGWLAALGKETDEAGNLVDLRDDLVMNSKALDIAPLGGVIGDALVLAELLGRAEVLEEIAEGISFSESPIASALRLPFKEAIAFFRDKVNIPAERWNDLFLDAHSKGFMIAGAMKGELLADLRDAVDQTIEQGLTITDFRKQWDSIVEKHGWAYVGGRNWRTRIVYETNTRQAYNAARWEQITDPDVLKTRPYLYYKHGDSVHPRPLHLAWDGTVLPADDPWWGTNYPQNGWGCKCKVFSVGNRDIARIDNAKRQAPDDGTYEWTDKQGRSFTIPNGIDPGFQYNPGAARKYSYRVLQDRIDQLPADIGKGIKAEIKEKEAR